MKNLITYMKVFLMLIMGFFLFSLLSCFLPDEPIRRNVERSVAYLEGIGEYPEPMISGRKHSLDYYMDALILNMIYSIDNQDPFKSALFGRSRQQGGPYTPQINHLKYSIENGNVKPNVEYARYWHGNTFFFRIFFLFTEYNELKWFIYMITSLLLVLFTIVLYKNTGGLMTFGMMSGLFMVNIYLMQFSMQLSPVLIICILACLLLVRNFRKRPESVPLVFFLSGAVVSYFDLLTAPLLTLGIPMLLWISLDSEHLRHSFLHSFKQLLIFGALWSVAYLMVWCMKWVITWPFIGYDIFDDVKTQVLIRSSAVDHSRITAIATNFNQLPLVIINIVLIVLIIFVVVRFNRRGVKPALLFLSVAALPFIWFFATANHSLYHFWYTYRILGMTVSGVFMAFISLITWHRSGSVAKVTGEGIDDSADLESSRIPEL